MPQEPVVGAAGVFEGVGENRKAGRVEVAARQSTLLVDGGSHFDEQAAIPGQY